MKRLATQETIIRTREKKSKDEGVRRALDLARDLCRCTLSKGYKQTSSMFDT